MYIKKSRLYLKIAVLHGLKIKNGTALCPNLC